MRYTEILKYTTPRNSRLAGIVLILLAVTATNLANPLIAGTVTASLLDEPGRTALPLGLVLLGWLGLLVLRTGLNVASAYLVGSTGADMAAELRRRVYEHMQVLPLTWFQERKQGDALSLLSSDAESISRFVTNTVVQLLPQLVTLTFAFLAMAWIDPLIAGLALLLLPLYTVVTRLIGRRIRPLSRAWIDAWSGLMGLVNENLGMMPALKAYTREGVESRRFADHNRELLNVSKKQIWLSALLTPTITLLAGAGALLLLWVGIRHVEAGLLQPSGLVTLLLYMMLLTGPLSGLAGVYGQAMMARGAAERLLVFFGEHPEPQGSGHADLANPKGDIEFREIDFAYPGRPALFENYSLRIAAGETVALTGPNGAGKSTLVHLLMRFIEPDKGQVLIDGVDIREVELASLRRQIGLVAQHTLLLNGTVAENVAYGLPDATLDEMKKAAKAARAEAFIEALPDGYDTVIGDQGVKLSGGQRQRLALTRALLKDPPILVLDEATSMFDPEGEKEFIEECAEALKERTVILVTHRPASLSLADRIEHMP